MGSLGTGGAPRIPFAVKYLSTPARCDPFVVLDRNPSFGTARRRRAGVAPLRLAVPFVVRNTPRHRPRGPCGRPVPFQNGPKKWGRKVPRAQGEDSGPLKRPRPRPTPAPGRASEGTPTQGCWPQPAAPVGQWSGAVGASMAPSGGLGWSLISNKGNINSSLLSQLPDLLCQLSVPQAEG